MGHRDTARAGRAAGRDGVDSATTRERGGERKRERDDDDAREGEKQRRSLALRESDDAALPCR